MIIIIDILCTSLCTNYRFPMIEIFRYMTSVAGAKAIDWASKQSDVKLIEWPLLSEDIGVESAQYTCLQRNHILRRSLVTFSSEISDFLRFSKSMLSVVDVISYLPPQCNYLSPNVYASVIQCLSGVGNKTLESDDCVSYSEMRAIKSSCRGRFNGILVAQSRVQNLNTFKLVSNHPVRKFSYSDPTFIHGRIVNRSLNINNEYYRKPFPSMSNYIDVVNHGYLCEMSGSNEVIGTA